MVNQGVVPSGNTTAAAHAYYNYLWAQYLGSIPPDRTQLLWSGIFYEALFLVALTLLFYLYARYALRTHRNRGEMYGIQSFAGSILERMGPMSVLEITIWVILILWVLYYIVTQIIGGYIYVVPVH
jgi:di/tricarboxylate transporter